jgi:hypothetical protein
MNKNIISRAPEQKSKAGPLGKNYSQATLHAAGGTCELSSTGEFP